MGRNRDTYNRETLCNSDDKVGVLFLTNCEKHTTYTKQPFTHTWPVLTSGNHTSLKQKHCIYFAICVPVTNLLKHTQCTIAHTMYGKGQVSRPRAQIENCGNKHTNLHNLPTTIPSSFRHTQQNNKNRCNRTAEQTKEIRQSQLVSPNVSNKCLLFP